MPDIVTTLLVIKLRIVVDVVGFGVIGYVWLRCSTLAQVRVCKIGRFSFASSADGHLEPFSQFEVEATGSASWKTNNANQVLAKSYICSKHM